MDVRQSNQLLRLRTLGFSASKDQPVSFELFARQPSISSLLRHIQVADSQRLNSQCLQACQQEARLEPFAVDLTVQATRRFPNPHRGQPIREFGVGHLLSRHFPDQHHFGVGLQLFACLGLAQRGLFCWGFHREWGAPRGGQRGEAQSVNQTYTSDLQFWRVSLSTWSYWNLEFDHVG